MKIMIAGLGSIGRRHLRNLLALGERDILLYRTQRSTLPDDELAGIPVETDLEAALARQPEAVIVSNPTALHMQVAIPAAQAGCHLLLEKPVAESMERIPELEAAVSENGVRVLVGFHFRYHPGLRCIRDLLAAGEIGRPLSVRAHWGEYLPGWHPWEDYRQGYSARLDLGGGVVLTLSHPLDYLRWLFGEVAALWAFTGKNSELELQVEDSAEIGLRFASGMLGSLHLDYNQRPAKPLAGSNRLAGNAALGQPERRGAGFPGRRRETGRFTRLRPALRETISSWPKCAISCRLPGGRQSQSAAWQMASTHCSLP